MNVARLFAVRLAEAVKGSGAVVNVGATPTANSVSVNVLATQPVRAGGIDPWLTSSVTIGVTAKDNRLEDINEITGLIVDALDGEWVGEGLHMREAELESDDYTASDNDSILSRILNALAYVELME